MFDLQTIIHLNEVAVKKARENKTAPLTLTAAEDLYNKIPVPIPFVEKDLFKDKRLCEKLRLKYADFRTELSPAQHVTDFKSHLGMLIKNFGRIYVGITNRTTNLIEISVWAD